MIGFQRKSIPLWGWCWVDQIQIWNHKHLADGCQKIKISKHQYRIPTKASNPARNSSKIEDNYLICHRRDLIGSLTTALRPRRRGLGQTTAFLLSEIELLFSSQATKALCWTGKWFIFFSLFLWDNYKMYTNNETKTWFQNQKHAS